MVQLLFKLWDEGSSVNQATVSGHSNDSNLVKSTTGNKVTGPG